MSMKPETKALTDVLLEHHRRVRENVGNPPRVELFTIQYGRLCERAGVPWLTRSVGTFLQETAEWCAEHGWPPINSLAVNDTGGPGSGYENAPGCSLETWNNEVLECIAFDGYPERVS